jgi:hypothetical protein
LNRSGELALVAPASRKEEIMIATLEDVLAYKNPPVVRRFQKDHPEKAHLAEQMFSDLMRFFWASKQHALARKQKPTDDSLNFVYIMDEEMRDIDQMWHVFLLYTQDYMDFCNKYFGEYLHHLPDIVPTFGKSFDFESNLEKFLDYTYDQLGEEVVTRWFAQSL